MGGFLFVFLIVTSVFVVSVGSVLIPVINDTDEVLEETAIDNSLSEGSLLKGNTASSMNRSKEIDDVLADNKYPFLFFSADWCGFCKQQKPILEELAQEYGDLIEFIWLTEEDARTEAYEFDVNGYPTMFLILGIADTGYHYRRFEGFTTKSEFVRTFKPLLGTKGLVFSTTPCTPYEITSSSAINAALERDTAVFLFFYADWCHFCHQQLPIIDALEKEYAGKLTFIRINADESPATVNAFEVGEFPTMIIITARNDGGYDKHKISGFAGKARLEEFVGLQPEIRSDAQGLRTPEKLLAAARNTYGHEAGRDAHLTAGSSVTCTSCEDCTRKLNEGLYETVILTQDIVNQTGNCITLAADNVVFDCSGHIISGDLLTAPFTVDYGIKVTGDNNVITKCNVGLFWYGIWLDSANSNVIIENALGLNAYSGLAVVSSADNTIASNILDLNSYGLALLNSSSTSVERNRACSNLVTDIWEENPGDNAGDNNTCQSTHNWNDFGTAGCTKPCTCLNLDTIPDDNLYIDTNTVLCSGVYYREDSDAIRGALLLNRSGITLDCNGSTIVGIGEGTGIVVAGQNNVTVKNCTVINYEDGMFVTDATGTQIERCHSSNNTDHGLFITDAEETHLYANAAEFNRYGAYFSEAWNTVMADNTFCHNTNRDIYFVGSTGRGNENICDKTYGWNDQGTTGCTYGCALIMTECTSCEDCSAKLNGGYELVRLKNNISSNGTCILFNTSNTIFDGQGYTLESSATGGEFVFGIHMIGETGNTVRNCKISKYESGIFLESSDHTLLTTNTLRANGEGIRLTKSSSNTVSDNNITDNINGITLVDSSNTNSFTNNIICNKKGWDIIAYGPTYGNMRSGNKCSKIANWNNAGNEVTWCDQVCTANQATTCSSASCFKQALDGDFNHIELNNNLYVPEGINVNASHLTIDCNNREIIGNGTSVGLLLENQVDVHIKNCTIRDFSTGVGLRSSAKNTLLYNTIANNSVGISIDTIGTVKAHDNSISENIIEDNRLYGVELIDTKDNQIMWNDFNRNRHYSLWVRGDCNHTVLNNNGGDGTSPILYQHDIPAGGSISGGTYSAVIYCNVHHAAIQNITVDNGNVRNDGFLLVDSGPIRIEHCSIENSRGIYSLDSHHTAIRHTTINSSKEAGIALENAKYSEIYENHIQNNNDSGILVDLGSHFAEIYNNTIQGNEYGILVRDSGSANISNNVVVFNNVTGIEIKNSIGNSLLRNTVRRNRFGLSFDYQTEQSTASHNDVCYNDASDIYNSGLLNTGSNNTCSMSYRWTDAGVLYPYDGCENKCIGWYQYNYGLGFHNPSKYPLTFGYPYNLYQGDMVDTFGLDQIFITPKICVLPVCFLWWCTCLHPEIEVSTLARACVAECS